jgi:hypothetical protein
LRARRAPCPIDCSSQGQGEYVVACAKACARRLRGDSRVLQRSLGLVSTCAPDAASRVCSLAQTPAADAPADASFDHAGARARRSEATEARRSALRACQAGSLCLSGVAEFSRRSRRGTRAHLCLRCATAVAESPGSLVLPLPSEWGMTVNRCPVEVGRCLHHCNAARCAHGLSAHVDGDGYMSR